MHHELIAIDPVTEAYALEHKQGTKALLFLFYVQVYIVIRHKAPNFFVLKLLIKASEIEVFCNEPTHEITVKNTVY